MSVTGLKLWEVGVRVRLRVRLRVRFRVRLRVRLRGVGLGFRV